MNLKRISLPKESKEIITAEIPEEIIRSRDGARGKSLSYISGYTATDLLDKAFGGMWSWTVKEKWIQDSIPYFNSYSKEKELVTYKGKKGAWEEQGPVAHVLGTLTVYFEDEQGKIISLSKDGFGSKSIIGNQSEQEDIFKAADTDAIKKAASRFGVGAELYRNEEESEFFNQLNYEDPWTDVENEKHAAALDTIKECVESFSLSEEDLNDAVGQFNENFTSMNDITPDNVDAFAEFLKELVKSIG